MAAQNGNGDLEFTDSLWKTANKLRGNEEQEDDGEPFDEKMKRLTLALAEQFEKSQELEEKIKVNLEELGHGF